MREYLVVLLTAGLVTFLATPVVRLVAVRLRMMAAPRERDVHVIPTPRGGGVAMYLGVAAAVLVATRLPALQRTFDDSQTAAVLGGRRADLPARRPGRQVRPRRPHQADRADRRRRGDGAARRAAVVRLPAGRRPRHHLPRAGRRRPADRAVHRADGQRAQLHRRPRRAGGGRLGHRRAGVLRLQLQPRPHRVRRRGERPGAHHRRPRRRLPGLPAAQLQPGPDLHGRLRLDARRPHAVGRRGVGDRQRRPAVVRLRGEPAAAGRCRSSCRSPSSSSRSSTC